MALPDAHRALRAARRSVRGRQVARRHRHDPHQPLPRGHDRDLRGRAHESDPPWGIFGGHEGTNASTKIITPEGQVEVWPSKFTGHTLSAGSTIEVAVPNSGGYGDPLDRDPELVLSDVLDGFTTVELAERDYGVVIDAERKQVDADATRRLRELARADAGARAT